MVRQKSAEQRQIAGANPRPATVADQADQADERASSAAKLREAVQQLNNSSQVVSRSLQFSVDKETGITIITVRDRDTDEVIRQIPAEEMLKLAQRMRELSKDDEGIKGILLSAEA